MQCIQVDKIRNDTDFVGHNTTITTTTTMPVIEHV